jgi:hypothetical protein
MEVEMSTTDTFTDAQGNQYVEGQMVTTKNPALEDVGTIRDALVRMHEPSGEPDWENGVGADLIELREPALAALARVEAMLFPGVPATTQGDRDA